MVTHFVWVEVHDGVATCEDGDHLPFITITASYLAFSVQQFLSQGKSYNFNIFPGGVTPF